MERKCFMCKKNIDTKIYVGFDKHFCSNMCRSNIYYINNSIDPSFKDPNTWVKKNEDIYPMFESIKKRKLSISQDLNKLNIDVQKPKNSENKKSEKNNDCNNTKTRETCNIFVYTSIITNEYSKFCSIYNYLIPQKLISSLNIF